MTDAIEAAAPDAAEGSGAGDGPEAGDGSSGEQQPQGIDPQKLLRIAGVTREVLEEARRIRPEPGTVDHLRRVHAKITEELRSALPAELYSEMDDLTPDIKDGTLEELALAHAEILGWLEGLFQGTQLALQAQAAQALHRLQEGPPRELPSPGDRQGPDRGPERGPGASQYL